MMQTNHPLSRLASRRPALLVAGVSVAAAVVVALILVSASGPSPGAIVSAALAGATISVVAATVFGQAMRAQSAAFRASAAKLADLTDHLDATDVPRDEAPVRDFNQFAFDRDVTAVTRAYRSLEREREQSHTALEQQIARQSEFYAKLSHELRSPLNAILGYASIALEDAEAGALEDLPQDLRKIRSAGQSLLTLIDNLLQLAEDRTGREAVDRVPFLLRSLLEQVIVEYDRNDGAIIVALQEDAGGETVFGNTAKLARAIGGVIDDAVRGHQATLVTLSTATRDSCVEILVDARSGSGKPTDAGQTLSRHLANRLAAAVSGSLDVHSRGDGELRYVLRLPLDSDRVAAGRASPEVIPAQSARGKSDTGQKSALLIDDDAATIDLMSRWLERSGYEVHAATSAEHGLALAEAIEPDIVLLDALMPGRTGYDILPDLSAIPALRDTPVLIVTVDDDRIRGLAAGASDYIRKPLTEARLREIVSVYEKDLEGEVLIVEDDRDAAELLDRMVRRLGFSSRHASDGVEGLEALSHARPVAILLDLNMPNLNGFEFIERIAQSEHYAAIPLIVLSGQELSVAQHHRLLAAGCRYYMKGSAAPRDIAATLREMVA